MNAEQSVNYIFSIVNEVKRSYEGPVIFLTFKDYEDQVFDAMVHVKKGLEENISNSRMQQIITEFHIGWLRAVMDINTFRKKIRETPRSKIQKAISFTIECVKKRNMYLGKYAKKFAKMMTAKDLNLFEAELEVVDQMMFSTVAVLIQKQMCFQYQVDQTEYSIKLNYEVEELLNWLDRIYNNAAVTIGYAMHPDFSQFIHTLTIPLKDIICFKNSTTKTNNKNNDKFLETNMTRYLETLSHDVEISKVNEKLQKLNSRLLSLNDGQSAISLGLRQQIVYLEDRLQTLDTQKQALADFKKIQAPNHEMKNFTLHEINIFCHFLPTAERCQMIRSVLKCWETFLFKDDRHQPRSLVTILSFVDPKELFTDEFGKFSVDEYGRKIYVKEDGLKYQINDVQELVLLDDEGGNVFYYDDCGRYYINENHQHIYKANRTASEYILNPNGRLVKWMEIEDNIQFNFDNLGKYYYNNEGKKIYRDSNNLEYENDGFGNLIKLQSTEIDYVVVPQELQVATADSKYLQKEIGAALKQCIKDVILHQPQDPLQYLAESLINYRRNLAENERMNEFEEALKVERANQKIEEDLSLKFSEDVEEESFSDQNMRKYVGWTSNSSLT